MQGNIHPKYYEATVTCACGNTFTVGSTHQTIRVDICSKCHPFFTGEMKFVDTLGRVERFQQRQQATAAGGAYMSKKAKLAAKKKAEADEEAARPKSLKEMFDRVKGQA